MRITWVTRSFLDYRIPVFKELDKLCDHQLTVIYYNDIVPERVQIKLKAILGDRAIARKHELRIGNRPKFDNAVRKSNSCIRIPISLGLIRQVLKTRPEALVSDGFMQWTYAPLFVRMFKKVPHVMCYERTAHTERNAGRFRILYRRFVSSWIDMIDCNGRLCGAYVKKMLGWTDDKLTYGHMVADVSNLKNACKSISDEQRQSFRQQIGVQDNEILLLFTGRLISRKGVHELLSAYCHIAENVPLLKLVIVGDGPLEPSLRGYVTSKQLRNVVITGGVDYDTIYKYYNAADCFILPTKEDNWSLVIPEAMACGLPVATTIYNGCYPELVHKENGWVFDSLNPCSIEDTLLKIYSSKDRLRNMGEVSENIVAGETPERAANSIWDAINKVINIKKK